MGLYHDYRPSEFSGLVGQAEAVKALEAVAASGNWPHAILLSGASGTGKTSTARIVRDLLGADPDTGFVEVNAADQNGIDMVRWLREVSAKRPLAGTAKMYLLDEVQSLSAEAQSGLLKLLEDPPAHAYFVLVTTNPEKLTATVKTRCMEFRFNPIKDPDMARLVNSVVKSEKARVGKEVVDAVVEMAQGSARSALVLLEKVIGLASDAERVECLQRQDVRVAAVELCRVFMSDKPDFKKAAKILKDISEEPPEGVRRLVMAYARTVLLSGGGREARAAFVLQCFFDPAWENKGLLALYSWNACGKG